jgi:hypothetical protein
VIQKLNVLQLIKEQKQKENRRHQALLVNAGAKVIATIAAIMGASTALIFLIYFEFYC